MKFILGKKIEMTQRFKEDGTVVPVTVVEAGPCAVVQVKTEEKDGYQAVQIGFGVKKGIKKPQAGHIKGLGQIHNLREFRTDETSNIKRGDVIRAAIFQPGDMAKVSGVSKGKGFQGVVKRHKFAGGKGSHGDKDQLRMPGSIGATDAARVFKGMRMAGQMGNQQATTRNLEIIEVDPEKNLIYIKGSVPGARGSLLQISAAGEMKIDVPQEKKEESKKQSEKKPNPEEKSGEKKEAEHPEKSETKQKK